MILLCRFTNLSLFLELRSGRRFGRGFSTGSGIPRYICYCYFQMSQRQREADGFGNIVSNEEFLEGMAMLLYLQRVCLLVKRWQRGHYMCPPEHVRSIWLHCVNNHFVKDAIFVQAVALHSVELDPLRTVRVMSCYLHDCRYLVSMLKGKPHCDKRWQDQHQIACVYV